MITLAAPILDIVTDLKMKQEQNMANKVCVCPLFMLHCRPFDINSSDAEKLCCKRLSHHLSTYSCYVFFIELTKSLVS